MLFNKKKEKETTINYEKKYYDAADELKEMDRRIEDLKKSHGYEIKDLEKGIELKEKDFEFQLAHQESEKVKELEEKNVELKQELAVSKEKISMLDKIVDLNSDVIDVKKLVEQLISKLPEVKISSLAVTSQEAKK